MSKITTHVLDTVLGKPAAGIAVKLERRKSNALELLSRTQRPIAMDAAIIWRRTSCPASIASPLQTGPYLSHEGRNTIYPEIAITFQCGSDAHYHLPLLLSDNSYTTYRGS